MTEAKFVPAAPAVSRPRRTVDPNAIANRVIAQAKEQPDLDNGPKVLVSIPHNYKLTDDGHIIHDYKAGQCLMPRAHFDHFYTKANGVTEVKP